MGSYIYKKMECASLLFMNCGEVKLELVLGYVESISDHHGNS